MSGPTPGPTHVALLRGVNVGGAKKVPMAALREVVEAAGFTEVRTLLASGNVVFRATARTVAAAAARIEAGLAERIGVTSRVTVLDAAAVAAIAAEDPLGGVATNDSRTFVVVPRDAATLARLAPLAARDWGPERVALGARALYLWCPDGVTDSAATKAVGKAGGDAITTRNRATMAKLHALLGGVA